MLSHIKAVGCNSQLDLPRTHQEIRSFIAITAEVSAANTLVVAEDLL